jgi:hypothetical protein
MSEYYLNIQRTGNCSSQWEWRILQRSRSIGICGTGFTTEEAARCYGEVALEKFLAHPGIVLSNAGEISLGDR